MSLKSAIVIITLVTIVALVGVGFATWTFDTTADAEIEDVTGKATAAIEASNLVVKNAAGTAVVSALYIICDKPGEGGIYWSTTADGSNPISQVKLIGSVNEDDNDILDFDTYTGTFTASMTGAPNSTTWINLPSFSLNQDVESESKNANVEYSYDLPTLTYKVTPASVADVNALQTEVNALDLTITFSFSVTATNAA